MKFLVLVGLSIGFLVASRLPADVDWHPQDEASVSNGDEVLHTAKNATDLIEATSEKTEGLGFVHAFNASLNQNAALRNESFLNVTLIPNKLRRRLECCGGAGGTYSYAVCPAPHHITRFLFNRNQEYADKIVGAAIQCSNGITYKMFGKTDASMFNRVTDYRADGFTGLYLETDDAVKYIEVWSTRIELVVGVRIIPNHLYNLGLNSLCKVCHRLDCPTGQKLFGIRGRSGTWLDFLNQDNLLCRGGKTWPW